MSDANPFLEAIRTLEYDIEQLKVDIGLVQNDEVKTYIRALIFEKQKTILALNKEFGEINANIMAEKGTRGGM